MEIGNQLPLNEETKKKLADLVYLYIISSHFEGKINIKAYRDIYYDINNYLEYMAICAYFAE
ncbi:MAG: hypothetical protein LBU14_02800 [Candidatus Peribacteria bacterium]|jgi:hypothetical protein|nr:hypothetical protein [Candidatus Peribacteria bacterium]